MSAEIVNPADGILTLNAGPDRGIDRHSDVRAVHGIFLRGGEQVVRVAGESMNV